MDFYNFNCLITKRLDEMSKEELEKMLEEI